MIKNTFWGKNLLRRIMPDDGKNLIKFVIKNKFLMNGNGKRGNLLEKRDFYNLPDEEKFVIFLMKNRHLIEGTNLLKERDKKEELMRGGDYFFDNNFDENSFKEEYTIPTIPEFINTKNVCRVWGKSCSPNYESDRLKRAKKELEEKLKRTKGELPSIEEALFDIISIREASLVHERPITRKIINEAIKDRKQWVDLNNYLYRLHQSGRLFNNQSSGRTVVDEVIKDKEYVFSFLQTLHHPEFIQKYIGKYFYVARCVKEVYEKDNIKPEDIVCSH